MTDTGKEYASALFSLAEENGELQSVFGELGEIKRLFDENPEYRDFLMSPGIPKKERTDNLEKLLSGSFGSTVTSFMCVLCMNGAVGAFGKVYSEYRDMYNLLTGRKTAKITSASELDDGQKARIIAALGKKYGGTIEAEFVTDPSVLGGVIVDCDGKITDGSLRTKLKNIEQSVSQEVITNE